MPSLTCCIHLVLAVEPLLVHTHHILKKGQVRKLQLLDLNGSTDMVSTPPVSRVVLFSVKLSLLH